MRFAAPTGASSRRTIRTRPARRRCLDSWRSRQRTRRWPGDRPYDVPAAEGRLRRERPPGIHGEPIPIGPERPATAAPDGRTGRGGAPGRTAVPGRTLAPAAPVRQAPRVRPIQRRRQALRRRRADLAAERVQRARAARPVPVQPGRPAPRPGAAATASAHHNVSPATDRPEMVASERRTRRPSARPATTRRTTSRSSPSGRAARGMAHRAGPTGPSTPRSTQTRGNTGRNTSAGHAAGQPPAGSRGARRAGRAGRARTMGGAAPPRIRRSMATPPSRTRRRSGTRPTANLRRLTRSRPDERQDAREARSDDPRLRGLHARPGRHRPGPVRRRRAPRRIRRTGSTRSRRWPTSQ
jgi:hypothetical protein